MTILASLARAYERLPEKPPFGYAFAKIGFLISLNEDGSVAYLIDPRPGEGSKRQPRMMAVPQAVKRTSGIASNFLWDKTSYVLGVTAAEGKNPKAEHQAFRDLHLRMLEGAADAGLVALRTFLGAWTPDQFISLGWPEDLKDQNVVFALESDRRPDNTFLHEREAATTLWSSMQADASGEAEICLVRGTKLPVARLHPSIKGVWGGQSSGGSIVSFNAAAYESYGHSQGDNAPVSEAAAFAYTTALNAFLAKDSKNRIQIGDASTVFWADASDAETAEAAQDIWLAGFADIDEAQQSERVRNVLEGLRKGRPLGELDPKLEEGVRFYVLGLAPNAARISIRFWFESDFADLARNYQRFATDMRIEPPPGTPFPPLWQYLSELAVLKKRENVPPNLSGEWMRAILTGNRYPLTLLTSVLMRIRADGEVKALRAAMLKAVLIRNFERKDTPVALDPDFKDKAYVLGRLFAVLENIQRTALGKNVNATIKDRYFGAASSRPKQVFATLLGNAQHHLAKIRKESPGLHHYLNEDTAAIMSLLAPADDPFPTHLGLQDQALFSLGYYHQAWTKNEKTTEALAVDNTGVTQ